MADKNSINFITILFVLLEDIAETEIKIAFNKKKKILQKLNSCALDKCTL